MFIRRFEKDFGPIHMRSQEGSLRGDCDIVELNGIAMSLLT